MERDPDKYLWDARRAADRVTSYAAGRTFDDFVNNQMLRDAVERQLLIVGEAIAQLVRTDPTTAQRITASRDIVAFRNILVHGYDALDSRRVWRVIHDDLPKLVREIDGLLGDKS